MAATAKLHPAFNNVNVRIPGSAAGAGLTMGEFFKIVAKSFEMVRAIPDSGRVTAKDMEKVRRIAETL